MKKRLLSLLLTLVMIMGMFPANIIYAHATEIEGEPVVTPPAAEAPEEEETASLMTVAVAEKSSANATQLTGKVGGVTAVATGVNYNRNTGYYEPVFKTLYAVDTSGIALTTEVTGQPLYATRSGASLSNPLTSAPTEGVTYYSYLTLENIGDALYVEEELVKITIPGYDVEYLAVYERDMGFSIRVVFSVTKPKPEIYVGGVGIPNGRYLAVGATKYSDTKPSGGYAYYDNKTLTLNNYSYSGQGYDMGSGLTAAIYAPSAVTVSLYGTNTLTATAAQDSYGIYGTSNINITGSGNLTATGSTCGIRSSYTLTVSNGTVDASGNKYGIYGSNVVVNGGIVTAKALGGTGSDYAIRWDNTFTVANGLTKAASTATTGPYSAFDSAKRNTYDRVQICAASVFVGGVPLPDGYYLASDSTTLTTDIPSGGYAYYQDGILTMRNYSYSGTGYTFNTEYNQSAVIYALSDVKLRIRDTNTLTQTSVDGYGVYCEGDLTILQLSTGSLSVNSQGYGITGAESVAINSGAVDVAAQMDAISTINFTINDGTLTATSLNGEADYCAINATTSFTVADNLAVQASTDPNGTLVNYVAADNSTYDRVVIKVLPIWVGGVEMTNGTYLANGATATTTTKPSGGYAYYKDGILTLNNYEYDGEGYNNSIIYADHNLTISLVGTNTLGQSQSTANTVYAEGGKLKFNGSGTFIGGAGSYVLYADDDLTINGGTFVLTGGWSGIFSFSGTVTINGGDITATGVNTVLTYSLIVNGGRLDSISTEKDGRAIYFRDQLNIDFTVAQGLGVWASTTADGALSQYVKADHNTYKHIVIAAASASADYVGGVVADGSGVVYDSTQNAYTPAFRLLYAVDTDGALVSNDISVSALYTARDGVVLSNPLTTEPVAGTTYYAYLSVSNPGGALYVEEELVDIQISGYEVTYLASYERDMGFTSRIVYSLTPSGNVRVGGVGMIDGDYLAVGATATTTTKPSGGYAYYKDGILTLNNYSYNGEGMTMDNFPQHCAAIYSDVGLTLRLEGSNHITVACEDHSACGVWMPHGDLTVEAADGGSLTLNVGLVGINVRDGDLVINSGDINVTKSGTSALYAKYDLTINGGNINISNAYFGLDCRSGNVNITGGTVFITTESLGVRIYGEVIDSTSCNINITGGIVNITSEDRCLRTDGLINISDSLTVLGSWRMDDQLTPCKEDFEILKRVIITSDDDLNACIWVGGTIMIDGTYLANGATTPTTAKPSGGYAYYKDGTLTLNNYSYTGEGCRNSLIYSKEKLTIRLVGSNHLTAAASTDLINGIWVPHGVTVEADSGAGLEIVANYYGIFLTEGDLIINGGDITASGIQGIATNDNIIVNGGEVEALAIDTAYGNAEYAIFVVYDLTVADGLMALASTTVDGELVGYVRANNKNYKRVVITSGACIFVGGVTMFDGEYLAVGATTPTTTKPSGGYAYYKDGTLTLNNYSYEGEGYKYGSVYVEGTDLTIELLGDNTLVQTQSGRDAICANDANLTIGGTGNLTCRGEDHGIWVGKGLTINGGTITAIGSTKAIHYHSSFGCTVAEGLTIQASTTLDGTLGEYVAANHDSYKKIVIAPAITLTGSATDGIKVKVEKLSGSATLIVAQYEGGKMVDVQTMTVSADGTYTMNELTHKTGCTYKAFLVNSTTYAPLCSADDF